MSVGFRKGRTIHAESAFLTGLSILLLLFSVQVQASVGDQLPEFRECVKLCVRENCGTNATPIPLHRRFLLWDCPAECDYTCQHIITAQRLTVDPPQPVVQFHGKWPFRRLWGMQEPFSVLCSLGNLWAHVHGLRHHVRAAIPASYPLRPYYETLARIGIATWLFSAIFHTRDFVLTERLDYFAAGASVLYGLYYSVVRLFRLYDYPRVPRAQSRRQTLLRAWTVLCLSLYAAHVGFLTFIRWDYGYNMAANVAVGSVQNVLWAWYTWQQWRRQKRRQQLRSEVRSRKLSDSWTFWPGVVVAWVLAAMSLELFDFPPLWGIFDAHGLWHLGTIAPAVLWYNFLVKDAAEDMASTERSKARNRY
ncbi:hypothetical protein VTK73DRAFT_7668 [Phialemonium thermophilum]|uniref:Post-GPI attachment to proteins factor 3 n=1 Tax=Phialemonium thermophilum TaxID=223376 RepID=A0ABR3Y7I7_9PEZI